MKVYKSRCYIVNPNFANGREGDREEITPLYIF